MSHSTIRPSAAKVNDGLGMRMNFTRASDYIFGKEFIVFYIHNKNEDQIEWTALPKCIRLRIYGLGAPGTETQALTERIFNGHQFLQFHCEYEPMMAGKAEATLSKLSRYEGVVRTSADFVAYLSQNGGRPEIREGVTSFYGSKWDLKESKPKTEHCIFLDEKIFVTVKRQSMIFCALPAGKWRRYC
jgi:hypothetical protein